MKKTLLSIIAASTVAVSAFGQCTPDPQYANSDFGLFPDTIPFVQACPGCMEFGADSRFVDFKTFTDTTVGGIPIVGEVTIYIDAFRVNSVEGIPAGLTYGTDVESGATAESPYGIWYNNGTLNVSGGNPANYTFQDATQGCLYINGSEQAWIDALNGGPNNDGIYPITVYVDARVGGTLPTADIVVPPNSWLSTVDTSIGGGEFVIDDYFLEVISGSVGIRSGYAEELTILENYPNPFSGVTSIRFNSEEAQTVKFSVYSILGEEVFTRTVSANYGPNKFDFDGSALPSGMYIYSLSNGKSMTTRKMTIK